MLGVDEASAGKMRSAAMGQENVICGYHTLIDWDKAGLEKGSQPLIEVRVTPQRSMGFATRLPSVYTIYPEARSVYLILRRLRPHGHTSRARLCARYHSL